jgi:hypothetical protein
MLLQRSTNSEQMEALSKLVSSEIHVNSYSSDVRADPLESAKSWFFDTSSWRPFCDVTLTLRQARRLDTGGWVKIDDYQCRQAFRHFVNLLNRAVYRAAFRRHGKRLRVLPVLEKGEVRACALRSGERGRSGRWHIHCAIELPLHFDAIALERSIRSCWAKVEWGYGGIQRTRKRGEHVGRGSLCAVVSVNPPGGDSTRAPRIGMASCPIRDSFAASDPAAAGARLRHLTSRQRHC